MSSTEPTPARRLTKRESSLISARILGQVLMVLGVANGVAGVIIGRRITQPAHDILGDVSGTEISPTGIAFIGNAIAVGVILLIAGAVVVAFANALKPEPQPPS